MPDRARPELATPPDRPSAESATHVAVAVEGAAGEDGEWQLVRLAPRRWDSIAAKFTAIVQHGGRLIAVFSIALVISALFALPRQICHGPSKVEVTTMKLKKYAFEAYPSWISEHPDLSCPRSLHELAEYMNEDDSQDAWGNQIEVRCGSGLPPGAKGMWVRSAGEDGRFDTKDDLDSAQ